MVDPGLVLDLGSACKDFSFIYWTSPCSGATVSLWFRCEANEFTSIKFPGQQSSTNRIWSGTKCERLIDQSLRLGKGSRVGQAEGSSSSTANGSYWLVGGILTIDRWKCNAVRQGAPSNQSAAQSRSIALPNAFLFYWNASYRTSISTLCPII